MFGHLKLWDVASGEVIRSLKAHWDGITSCAFSADGQRYLSGSHDNLLKLWDGASDKEIRIFRGHSNRVRACAFSPDGQRLLSGSDDKTLKLWDAASGECLRTWPLPFPACSISWMPGPPDLWPERAHPQPTQAVAVAQSNGTVLLFDLTEV